MGWFSILLNNKWKECLDNYYLYKKNVFACFICKIIENKNFYKIIYSLNIFYSQ